MKNLSDKINESHMDPGKLHDKLEEMIEAFGGADKLLEEIFQWFESDKMQECLEDIDNTYDCGVF